MLVGRGPEVELIGSFLDRAAAEGGALLLTGDPGVGKTMLLDAAAATAEAAGLPGAARRWCGVRR